MSSNQDIYLDSIAALMKRGRGDEIASFFAQEPQQEEETFVSYMDGLIKKSGMSRAKIVSSVGLSKDYMYKVLRGDKQTTERDYIIAVCLAMKANVLETQKALELYPFPVLDCNDMRSAIILSAINEGADCYTLDDWLEKVQLPLLKVSPDMPSVKVGPVRSTHYSEVLVNSKADEEHKTSQQRRFIEMEKTDTFKVVEHFGNAPFDFFYLAEFELTDEDDKKVYVEANFWPDGSSLFGVTQKSVQENLEEEDPDFMIESYETLEDATESKYFPYFLELDKLTDQMTAEKMAEVNDTKTYGFRMSGRFTGDGIMMYSEAFNSQNPELNEYLQVRQTADGFIYSVSRKSYYMQMELNEGLEGFYEMYFGKADKPLYLFEVTSLDDLGDFEHYRTSFEQMIFYMKQALHQMTMPPEMDTEDIYAEDIIEGGN